MGPRVKLLTTKSEDLSSIPGNYMVEGETRFTPSCPLEWFYNGGNNEIIK